MVRENYSPIFKQCDSMIDQHISLKSLESKSSKNSTVSESSERSDTRTNFHYSDKGLGAGLPIPTQGSSIDSDQLSQYEIAED